MAALAGPQSTAPGGPETHDSILVRRARRGDDRAFELLYARYHRRITAYIQGMVHDHARAEDITQDVFVAALRRMRATDRPIAFKPWIYEIAKNACIDQFRRTRRAEEVSFDADEGLGAADYGRMVSTTARPDASLENKQALDDLRGAFGGLSEAHHEILVMRELEGLSYREIGERLGMSRPSVESTLFRARRRLTEEYEELVSGARCQRIGQIICTAAAAELGARDQRRLARHVSHCQPCRHQARVAGLDIPVGAGHPVRARIAALLPLPLFLRRRWSGLGADSASSATSHASSFAQWSSQLGSTVDPSWIKAAATAATVAVAGMGVGVVGHSGPAAAPAGELGQIISGLRGSGGAAHADRLSAGRTSVTPIGSRSTAGGPVRTTTAETTTAATLPAAAGFAGSATVPAPTTPVEHVASGVSTATDGLSGRPPAGSAPGTGSASASGVATPAVPPAPLGAPGVPALDTSKAAAGAATSAAAAAQATAGAVGSLTGGG